MPRKTYPSDINREQFEQIRSILESARKRTKPRTTDLYEVCCGVLYVLKGGIQWAMLPEGFPKWRTVYNYFQIWSEPLTKHQAAIAPMHQPLAADALTDTTTTLDLVLKKIGWRGPTQPWSYCEDQLLHR
jgi:hypothetical protein